MFSFFIKISTNLTNSVPFIVRQRITALRSVKMLSTDTTVLPLIAVCQSHVTNDKDYNKAQCTQLIHDAHKRGCKMIFLPEALDYLAEKREEKVENAEPLDGALVKHYKQLAIKYNVWLSLGGLHVKTTPTEKQPQPLSNTHIIIDSSGNIKGTYEKTHLFDIEIPGFRIKESDLVHPGNQLTGTIKTPIGRLGMAICYDMRFPELSLALAQAGAEIITFPSAFTVDTGMAHWETILRCRAIETQCYVVAAAQVGTHNPKRSSYGHAMIVDPWGAVIAQTSKKIGIATAEIDLAFLRKIRQSIPVWKHRRPDLYGMLPVIAPESTLALDTQSSFEFGNTSVKSGHIFYKTNFTMTFVNKMPILKGHVVVAPIRTTVKRLGDANDMETCDFFATIRRVQEVIEKEFGANDSTVSINDGAVAGRSIEHLHAHVLPRKPGDFKVDNDVYVELQTYHTKTPKNVRTDVEMAEEANRLRRYFH